MILLTRYCFYFVVWASLSLFSKSALSHQPSDTYMTIIEVGNDALEARWHIALRDLDYVFDLDTNKDQAISWGEFMSHSELVEEYAKKSFRLYNNKELCSYGHSSYQIDKLPTGVFVLMNFTINCSSRLNLVDLEYDLFFSIDPSHRGIIKLTVGNLTYPIVFSDVAQKKSLTVRSLYSFTYFLDYISLGFFHILSGFDHVLFILCLVLSPAFQSFSNKEKLGVFQRAPSFINRRLILLISLFTVAHSTSLLFSATGLMIIPSRVVESFIALSVLFVALNNIFGLLRRWEPVIVFFFGLLHGLGFSSILNIVGLPVTEKLLSLLFFNAGIEMGQLFIIFLAIPLLYLLARLPFKIMKVNYACSLMISFVATLWFFERAFDVAILNP